MMMMAACAFDRQLYYAVGTLHNRKIWSRKIADALESQFKKESTSADGLDPQSYGLAQVWGRELVGARAQVAVLDPSSTVKVSNKG